MSSSKPATESGELTHIKAVWSRMQGNCPIYDFLFGSSQGAINQLSFISATKGSFVCHLTLAPQHLNSRGHLHGSVSATIVDWAGGFSIATHGLEKTGASVDIHVNYQSTATLEDVVAIEGTCTKLGGSLAFTDVVIRKVKAADGSGRGEGEVVAKASHTKYIRR